MEKILKKVYGNEKISKSLVTVSHLCVLSSLVGFAVLSLWAFFTSHFSLLTVALVMGVPFAIVTGLRILIDAKRPYEFYDFYEKKPKQKKGRSFPSRHAYSSFVISSMTVFVDPIFGGILLFIGILMCICRVLLGIHFIRDVIAGAFIGALTGVLGVLIFTPF